MFKEFPNPEEKDYDITSSLNSEDETLTTNPYSEQLIGLVGFLEDGEWENYGLTEEEYSSPTEETIIKLKEYLGIKTR